MAILDLSKAVSRTWCETGGKLVLITDKKSYMSFRLVPKSATLNDLERRNGLYFALFHRIRVEVSMLFKFAISSPDEFLDLNLRLHLHCTCYYCLFPLPSFPHFCNYYSGATRGHMSPIAISP